MKLDLEKFDKSVVRPWPTQSYRNSDILALVAFAKDAKEALEHYSMIGSIVEMPSMVAVKIAKPAKEILEKHFGKDEG